MRKIIFALLLPLFLTGEVQPPPKDASKEYREQFYFHYDFYIDDANEEGDTVKATLKNGIPYEGDIGVIIDELTRAGSIAIDIGSHIGVHTITMSKKVGPQGKVFAFEPNRKLGSELLYNLELNHCHNVTPIFKAAGDKATSLFLRWGKIDPSSRDLPDDKGYFVDVVPLDAYHLENVSLIKMDVENFEYPVLLGAQETIRKSKPVIIFECMLNCNFADIPKEEQKKNFTQVTSLLQSMGYEIRIIHCCNFIAFPQEDASPLTLYRKKFRVLDLESYDPEKYIPLGNGIEYFRNWLPNLE